MLKEDNMKQQTKQQQQKKPCKFIALNNDNKYYPYHYFTGIFKCTETNIFFFFLECCLLVGKQVNK